MSETIESIDESSDKKGAFDKLVDDLVKYLEGYMDMPGQRLILERSIAKYAESNTQDWLLNIIICVHKRIK